MSKQIKLFLPTPKKLTPIQLLIMIQLLGNSKYGYEIIRCLREGFKGLWEPKTGTVYPALNALQTKGHITKSLINEKTHYSLTEKGREIIQEMSDYVAEYLLFNSRFIESTVDSMPPSFTQEVFSKIHDSGIDEILPEATILEAIRQLPNKNLKRAFLELRNDMLHRKIKLVKNQMKELDS